MLHNLLDFNLGLILLNLSPSIEGLANIFIFDYSFICLVPLISLKDLTKDKLYVYLPDNKRVAYVFDTIEQAARELTPKRCSHLSDIEISQKKNIRYLRRVINKGVLSSTEKGKFYLYQNPNHSKCLSLVS